MDENALRAHVNASGYPFQARVAHEIRQTSGHSHEWAVAAEEFPWYNDRDNTQGYADLILSWGRMRIVVECKRLGEGGTYIFLQSDPKKSLVHRARLYWTKITADRQVMEGWDEMTLLPPSPESQFCVVPGTGPKDRPLIERVAAELVSACEAVGSDQVRGWQHDVGQGQTWFVVPLIVTTAELVTCKYEPSDVALDAGVLSGGSFEPKNFIRFRKGLSTRYMPGQRTEDLGELALRKERTVIIVRAAALIELLARWNLSDAPGTFHRPWA
jgi:hypothetical protein